MGEWILPIIILAVMAAALIKRSRAFESFTDGAWDGMKTTARIFPSILAMLTAVGLMRASGLMDAVISLLTPISEAVRLPAEVMPLAVLKPFSGGGSLGILSDILTRYGADSRIGMCASVLMGSTETTFYVMCVYFAGLKTESRAPVLVCAVIGDIAAVIAAGILTSGV